MTRVDAAALVDALDDYLDACFAALLSSIAKGEDDTEGERVAMAVRERLIDALSGSESTQPTARPL